MESREVDGMAVTPTSAGRGGRVAVDWVYIQTRTLIVLGLLLVVGLCGGAWWWLAGQSLPLEKQAAQSIIRAESLEVQARAAVPGAGSLTLAREHLGEAHSAFDSQHFTRALDEARAAEAISREILDGGGLDESGVRIVQADGDVRIKRSGQFMWEPANVRSMLAMGDQIRTGAGASAQLIYFDGTVMTMRSGTLLEIRELFRDSEQRTQRVSERLAWGSLKASTNETAGIEGVHEVSTAATAVRADRASEFTVEHDREKGRSQVTALRGELKLETSDGEVAISESTRVAMTRGTIVGQSKILAPPMLKDPPDQKTFLAPRESQVHLSWMILAQAESYHLQLSPRPMFSRMEYEQESLQAAQATLPPLAPGTYYWRVTGVDAKGYPGRWSDTRKFRVLGAEFRDPDDTKPPSLEISEILVIGTNAIISGRAEAGALMWIGGERVDLDESGAFTWVIKLHKDGENRIVFQAQDAAGNETTRVGYAFVDVF